jgi:hypothetical protein
LSGSPHDPLSGSTSRSSTYVARFIEGTLGLSAGSLGPDQVPRDIAAELTSVLRGSPASGPTSAPYLETRIRALLPSLERSAIEKDGFFVRKARWPNAAPLAVCLTHDVDNIERPLEHIMKLRDRFRQVDLRKAMRGEISLYDNIELIAEREGAERFRSSFYFLSSNYPLEKVKRAARKLDSKGWEIGLHGDFGTHDSDAGMQSAVKRIAEEVGIRPLGLREHYLKFDFARSWGVMERAGLEYDTTVGNNDRLGFKLGLASPFHPPDADWHPMNILELPLSLMDTTLWGYLKKSEEEGFSDVLSFMDKVEEVEGLFTLLWHQEAVRMKGGRLYWRILRTLGRRKRLFVANGLEIARWWRAREETLLTVSPMGDGERRREDTTAGGTGEDKKKNKRERGDRVRRTMMMVTLDRQPPEGLRLLVKAKRGARLRVVSGSVERRRTSGPRSNARVGKKDAVAPGDRLEEWLISPHAASFGLDISRGD